MILTRRHFAATTLGLAALPRLARAADLGTPTGKVILTVSGKIQRTNADGQARFDRTMLEGLGSYGFSTHTPWYDGEMRFDGIRMSSLMDAVQPTGDTVVATALNDYETRIPISDFKEYGVLLALKRNGEYMPVRDKGPLFIVYPFDENPSLQIQKIYGRCPWQLARMTIV